MRMSFAAGLLGLLVGCTGVVDSPNKGTGGDDTNDQPDAGGGGNQPDAPPAEVPHIAATVDQATVATELGKTISVKVTVVGSGGFSGPVTVTPTGIDPTWTVTAPTTGITLTANGTGSATWMIDVPTDSAVLTSSIKFAATATGVTESDATSAVTVANNYTITIAAGTGTAVTGHATLPKNTKLKSGATLTFHNADTIAHRIHAGGGGFAHEPNDLQPNSDYKVTPADNETWYCHDHEGGGQGRNLAFEQ